MGNQNKKAQIMKNVFAIATFVALTSATLQLEEEEDSHNLWTRQEFYDYGASNLRYDHSTIPGDDTIYYDEPWDADLLYDDNSNALNPNCVRNADLWTRYCHNDVAKPKMRYMDYTIDGECSYTDLFKQAMCERTECYFTYCHEQRDLYVERCTASTQQYRDRLNDDTIDPLSSLTLTNYFETRTFPSGSSNREISRFISKRPKWN